MMRSKEAFEMAVAALKEKARAAHQRPAPGSMVTCDMCPCGMSTGVGKTEMCRAVGILNGIYLNTDWDNEE